VSSIGSPRFALAGFLHKVLSPLVGQSQSFVKNSGHFIELLKPIKLHPFNTLVNFDVVSLFTNVPLDEALQVNRNKLQNDHIVTECSSMEVGAIMDLLEVCLKTNYFQVDDKFFQQKDCMSMGNALFPVVSKICMEHFEELALGTAAHRPSLWLRYVDDTFVIWPHEPDSLQEYFCYVNGIRPTIQFTMVTEA
jgi:hypothetical protein